MKTYKQLLKNNPTFQPNLKSNHSEMVENNFFLSCLVTRDSYDLPECHRLYVCLWRV